MGAAESAPASHRPADAAEWSAVVADLDRLRAARTGSGAPLAEIRLTRPIPAALPAALRPYAAAAAARDADSPAAAATANAAAGAGGGGPTPEAAVLQALRAA